MAKKVGRGILYAALFCILLRACGIITLTEHEHEWQDATCTEPRMCATCDVREGEPMGHDWQDATCAAPKTCARCGKTEGSCADHTWTDATCTEPEHCSVCGRHRHWYALPLGHDWQDATCTAPKTCARCGETEGELQHYFVSYHWETTIEPTCQNEGEAAHNCLLCGAVETKTLPIIDHEAGDWAIIQKATPTASGIRVKLCTMCEAEMEREEYPYQPADTGTAATTGGGGGGNNFNTYDNEEQQNTAAKYVLNTSTRVFHRPTCRDVPKISPENYSVTNRTREDLTSRGWHRCGHCSP